MEEIRKRLRQLRGYLGLKQGEFSKRLKMPQNSYSQIETGVNPIKDRHIALVCYTFGVNEIWLRTGVGEMIDPGKPEVKPHKSPVVLDQDGASINKEEMELLEIYRELIPANQELIRSSVRIALASQKNTQGGLYSQRDDPEKEAPGIGPQD